MNWFINLSTKSKLFFSFGLIVLFVIAGFISSYSIIRTLQNTSQRIIDEDMVLVEALTEVRANMNIQRVHILQMLMSAKQPEKEKLAEEVNRSMAENSQLFQQITELTENSPKIRSQIDQLKNLRQEFARTREQTIELILQGKTDAAIHLGTGIQSERFSQIESLALEIIKEAKDTAQADLTDAQKKTEQAVRIFVFGGVLILILGLIVIRYLAIAIAKPLKEISKIAERVSAGDLTVNITDHNRQDEVGRLALSFSNMIMNLRGMTREILEGMNVLASSASEILASTTQVASGASETAAAINETTTTVEEVKQTAQLSSQKAKFVSDSAQKASQTAQGGKKSVQEALERMNLIRQQMETIGQSIVRLSEQSQAIGEIITTVNDLAEQSNLLAVNAAIEAAKAGEQGKGFSVVAQEIKSLAEQSKQATTQVRSILNDIQKATSGAVMSTEQGSKAVEVGVKQSEEAGESIRLLADSIVEATQAAIQIAASSQQQLVGVDQVAGAMENIKQASTQNVASTKQAEAAAKNLHDLGQKLKGLVERYKV